MKFLNATRKYEAWLGRHTRLIRADLALKHLSMAEEVFPFLRATFYRWMQLCPEVAADAAKAPALLAVGDLHVENFGTWRDADGRMVWGINDFDEAYPLPYTLDLVRLAASAHLAIAAHNLSVKNEEACEAILEGYSGCLKEGGKPFVLEEEHGWLRQAATGVLRDPVHFWGKMQSLTPLRKKIPQGARKGIESLLPEKGLRYRLAHRVAGLGSLGRERYVALAEWRGGLVAREAKALVPSACTWASGGKGSPKIFYQEIMTRAERVLDPFVRLRGCWIVRRLAPHCTRIELEAMPKQRDETRLLHAMGWETANVHWGSRKSIPHVRRDLARRPAHWLHDASKVMVKATMKDWEEWKNQ
ncbi:MAG: hypothetical protein DMG21_02545 [Acidobacteria bacterium]|nr:MAG: hypothetical protein DMG21_02545 [Acidobacteriota bacterium]